MGVTLSAFGAAAGAASIFGSRTVVGSFAGFGTDETTGTGFGTGVGSVTGLDTGFDGVFFAPGVENSAKIDSKENSSPDLGGLEF